DCYEQAFSFFLLYTSSTSFTLRFSMLPVTTHYLNADWILALIHNREVEAGCYEQTFFLNTTSLTSRFKMRK
ncbi:MAG: hypothetical protein LBS86_07130, partial [Treponema sp.]|nr:hypothetical protein [Treponema sp.]